MTSAVVQNETEASKQFRGYPVQLERFEGPLDLLLDLIKQNKEEIWDISITRITQQYLDYIGTLQALEIEVAGEFLVMAATLMRIKSQLLLPRPSFVPQDEEDDGPLTREGLIAKLIEYRRIREAAEHLRRCEGEQGRRFVRGTPAMLEKGYQLPLRDPRLVDLVRYFREVLERDTEELRHEVQLEEVDLDDQMEWVRLGLRGEVEAEPMPDGSGSGVRFTRLLRNPGAKMEVVVTFLAVLELSKAQRLRSWQMESFQEIWLSHADPETEEEASVAEGQVDDEAPESWGPAQVDADEGSSANDGIAAEERKVSEEQG